MNGDKWKNFIKCGTPKINNNNNNNNKIIKSFFRSGNFVISLTVNNILVCLALHIYIGKNHPK